MIVPEAPFLQPLKRRWRPAEMATAPPLPEIAEPIPLEPYYALLINPFYPKDPAASFGKHVLTPSLAMTSFAATTPDHWRIRYWDENLLDGLPPLNPIPQVVGITVHLTFAGGLDARSHVGPAIDVHQAVRTIAGDTEEAARPMVLKAAREDTHPRGVQGRCDALAGLCGDRLAFESECQRMIRFGDVVGRRQSIGFAHGASPSSQRSGSNSDASHAIRTGCPSAGKAVSGPAPLSPANSRLQLVESARAASDRLTQQMLTLGQSAAALEQHVEETAKDQREKDSEAFVRRVSLLIDSMHSAAIDVGKILSDEIDDKAWESYIKGNRGVFTRRAVRLLGGGETRAIKAHYDADLEFQRSVNRYIADFETMLRRVVAERDGGMIAVTLMSSDMGKLYAALAQVDRRR